MDINPIDLSAFLAERVAAAARAGIETEVHFDFDELYALDLPGKTVSPLFSPDHFDLTPASALWISGKVDGRIVKVQAIRLQHCIAVPLSTIWHSEFRRLFGATGASGEIAPEGRWMTGRCSYHGDLWLHPDLRGQGLGPLFASIGLAVAAIQFRPDVSYGFVEDPVAWTGNSFREGFLHQTPLGSGWSRGRGFLLPTDYLVWSTADDLARLIDRDRRQAGSRTRPQNQTARPSGKPAGNS